MCYFCCIFCKPISGWVDNFSSLFNVNSIPHSETTEKWLEESLESYVPYSNLKYIAWTIIFPEQYFSGNSFFLSASSQFIKNKLQKVIMYYTLFLIFSTKKCLWTKISLTYLIIEANNILILNMLFLIIWWFS